MPGQKKWTKKEVRLNFFVEHTRVPEQGSNRDFCSSFPSGGWAKSVLEIWGKASSEGVSLHMYFPPQESSILSSEEKCFVYVFHSCTKVIYGVGGLSEKISMSQNVYNANKITFTCWRNVVYKLKYCSTVMCIPCTSL